jgi:trimethylamine:corrinoid methyltransferase-like protein
MVKYMLRPFRIDENTVPIDVFDRVGPAGNFLLEMHTVENFRKSFWFPRVMDRTRTGTEESEKDKGMWDRLHKKAAEIRSKLRVSPLPNPVQEKIKSIVKAHVPDAS